MAGRYFNDDGEPLMTAAQARFEDSLDEQSASENVYARDDYGDYLGWD